jgi:hypothetical protein
VNVYVTGFQTGKKIHAIKGIRAATGLSLKDAKNAADHVEAGHRVKLALHDARAADALTEHGVTFERVPTAVSAAALIDILSYYPRDFTLGAVISVLRAAEAHAPTGDAS